VVRDSASTTTTGLAVCSTARTSPAGVTAAPDASAKTYLPVLRTEKTSRNSPLPVSIRCHSIASNSTVPDPPANDRIRASSAGRQTKPAANGSAKLGSDRNRCPPTIGHYQRRPECRSGTRRKLERDAIVRSLQDKGGNKQEAARALGMSRATIYRKINDYGIA